MTTPTRPSFIDVRSESQASVARPLRSPRLHVAGEHPPELSPLDAFALQSRLLAKQLEESARAGRRMSRLPPLTTESPLIVQGRSDYFRSMSLESSSDLGDISQQNSAGPAMRPEVEESPERPKSLHPRMSQIPPTPDASMPMPTPNSFEQFRGRGMGGAEDRSSYFGGKREHSPSSFDSASIDARLADDAGSVHQQELLAEPPTAQGQGLASPRKLEHKASHESLAPPVFPKRTSSIQSQPIDGPDDDVLGSSFHSNQSRKLSSSSASVFSPHQRRSPSVSSNMSELPRPAFNFSRPMSRSGTPGLETPARMDLPTRQPSSDSHSSLVPADDAANTPVSINSETFPDMLEDPNSGASSYIYSKYSLPRGKLVQRANSKERGVPASAAFQWEQPVVPPSNVQTIPYGGQAPPSPPTRPSSSGSKDLRRPSEETNLDVPHPTTQPSPNNSRPSTSDGRPSEDVQRGRSQTRPSTATATTSDASTIKARSQHSVATTMADTPADEHVNKAVALHEEGKLNESTYHLRYAAKQGHPTGMLLYALACRHGWGMRPNQPEAVSWLRKAAECAGVEIAEDESNAKGGQHVDVTQRKTRKAQLALSIYELGVSHMNGWGIEQDKALALRCFEIAGSWGDVDALAEAGFCYAKGIGCKKNLKKAAKFYRQAEAKGMSMVGNSWIHKPKYDDDEEDDDARRMRSKSKSRFFGKGRSNTTATAPS
ncbi:Protein DSF2 [Cytospora mali]|uniref:Protein DSF2 n=1 Tax=Cytospora mali TaxID=578113 RepID=A0A194VSZ5_CYTMA|nr:Protein DSF2 [Valsa mali]